MKCADCGKEIDNFSEVCSFCGYRNTVHAEPVIPRYSLKWHNFLMVVMIIGGILTILNGILTVAGTNYVRQGVTAEQVYRVFPRLKACDILYGIALIGMGIFEIIVRNRLHNFSRSGVSILNTLYILSPVITVLYLLLASSATNISLLDASTAGSVIASVVLLFINITYYGRRKDLFIN